MSRFSQEYRDSKPAHAETSDALFDVMRRLITVLEAGGEPDISTRQDCISTLSAARKELEQCHEFSDGVMYLTHDIADFRQMKHQDIILWITDVSIALKLYPMLEDPPRKQLSVEMLERGKSLILDLETCRKRVRWD